MEKYPIFLVVIAIIGILAVPSLFKHINKAKISNLKADITEFELVQASFYLDNGRLPCTDKLAMWKNSLKI